MGDDGPVTAPGWHPDPQVPGQLRWWDGTTWTSHVATPSATAATAQPGSPLGPPNPSGAVGVPGAPGAPSSGRRGLIIGLSIAGALVVVVLLVSLPFVLGRSSSSTQSSPPPTNPRAEPTTTAAGEPPTTAGSDLTEQAAIAGIPVLDEEGSATHTHTLLRILVDGDEIVIPAGIGIDARAGQIAAVHTHESTGVLHVESPHRNDVYTVGQFLTLWGAGQDEDALCEALAEGPCTVAVDVVAPSAADERAFDSYGAMPATPPIAPAGLDTELAQGAVIQIDLTTR